MPGNTLSFVIPVSCVEGFHAHVAAAPQNCSTVSDVYRSCLFLAVRCTAGSAQPCTATESCETPFCKPCLEKGQLVVATVATRVFPCFQRVLDLHTRSFEDVLEIPVLPGGALQSVVSTAPRLCSSCLDTDTRRKRICCRPYVCKMFSFGVRIMAPFARVSS